MNHDFVTRLTAQSTIGELPAYSVALDLSIQGRVLGDTLEADPDLPGVVVTEDGKVLGAISRGQYLRLVSRNFGREVFHPRPLRLVFEAVETTVEPLVLDESTPIQEAVQKSLERPRALMDEPVLLRRTGGDGALAIRLIDFQDLLRADSRISVLRNRQMTEILSTVQEGFLLVDRDFRIASEYSSSIERIFARRGLGGARLPEILAEAVGEEKAELAAGYLKTLFNPNVIEKLVVEINPLRQVAARLPGEDALRHLAFRFHRSVESGVIRRVLVRVEDISREIELAAELEDQEQRSREKLDLVWELLQTDADGLAVFLSSLERELDRTGSILEAPGGERQVTHHEVKELFRHIHALKGEAGLLGLGKFREALHRFEDSLAELRDRKDLDPDDLATLSSGVERLRELCERARSAGDQIRQLGRLAGEAPPPGPGETEPGSESPASPGKNGSGPAEGAPPGLFDAVGRLVDDLSRRLAKPARFVSRNEEEEVPEKYRTLVKTALIQFSRNAIVHGLEPCEERRQRGKPEVGTLQFAIKQHPQHGRLELVFQDDGAGLDLAAIRRRADDRGLEAADDRELAAMIFESGFSTALTTTEDAGRGVGMDVVKSQVESRGGTIRPYSEPGRYCAFQIFLPL